MLDDKELNDILRVLEYDNERSANGSENVTGIKFNKKTIIMAVGDTSDALVVTLTPKNGLGGRLTWHSSNNSVITVDSRGRITAVGEGTAAAFTESENGMLTACGVYVLPYRLTAAESTANPSVRQRFIFITKTVNRRR